MSEVEMVPAKREEEVIIYTNQTGKEQVSYSHDGNPSVSNAWRDKLEGGREEVIFFLGWGWMNEEERYQAKQTWPRDAP